MIFEDIFENAEIIHSYTDTEAIEDGTLFDSSGWFLQINGRIINRITSNALYKLEKFFEQTLENGLTAKINELLRHPAGDSDDEFIVINQPMRLWILPNETGGMTLMLPSDY